jgi:hypothetical protein
MLTKFFIEPVEYNRRHRHLKGRRRKSLNKFDRRSGFLTGAFVVLNDIGGQAQPS